MTNRRLKKSKFPENEKYVEIAFSFEKNLIFLNRIMTNKVTSKLNSLRKDKTVEYKKIP
jgi:hypothetical protein